MNKKSLFHLAKLRVLAGFLGLLFAHLTSAAGSEIKFNPQDPTCITTLKNLGLTAQDKIDQIQKFSMNHPRIIYPQNAFQSLRSRLSVFVDDWDKTNFEPTPVLVSFDQSGNPKRVIFFSNSRSQAILNNIRQIGGSDNLDKIQTDLSGFINLPEQNGIRVVITTPKIEDEIKAWLVNNYGFEDLTPSKSQPN